MKLPTILGRLARLCGLSLLTAALAFAQSESKRTFNIPAAAAEQALKAFSEQSGHALLISSETAKGVKTKAIKGEFTAQAALEAMLFETGLVASQDKPSGAYVVKKEGQLDPNVNRAIAESSARPDRGEEEKVVKLDTFEVMASKLLNMDKPRTRDDAQPYVVFDRTEIQQSGATNLEEFFRTRLPMNTTSQSSSQTTNFTGNQSSINLRGLGPDQTLILIDGRRVPGPFRATTTESGGTTGDFNQPDINGIPLSAVERVEVLPSTASGIYGGGATGGAINIILRRDYQGAELRLTYDNAFDTDASRRRVDLSASFTLEGGKTRVMFNASYSDASQLSVQDRDFTAKGRALLVANNPAAIFGITTPPLGATANIRSVNGSNLVLKSGATLNSPITFSPVGYAGVTSDGGAALVANAGKYNLAIAPGAVGGGLSLLNGPKVKSIAGSINRQFGKRFQLFLDLSANENHGSVYFSQAPGSPSAPVALQSTAQSNPFTTAILVVFPAPSLFTNAKVNSDVKRATAGILIQLPAEWKAEADFSLSRTKYEYATRNPLLTPAGTTAVSNGTLDILRDQNVLPIDYSSYETPPFNQFSGPFRTTLTDFTVRAAGPLGRLPSGPVTLSTLVEYRSESLSDSFQRNTTTLANLFNPGRDQNVSSAYMETTVPVVSKDDPRAFLRELEFQVAGRFDSYETNAVTNTIVLPPLVSSPASPVHRTNTVDSTDFTVGARWSFFQGLDFRVSYGTGFLPPSLRQLIQGSTITGAAAGTVLDPKRGNTSLALTGPIAFTSGGNPELTSETSESWSGGVILQPKWAPRFRLSVDYTRIEKLNEISTLNYPDVIANEDSLPGRVTRGPNLAGDPVGWAGPVTAIDQRMANLSRTLVEAFDAQIDYLIKTQTLGSFKVSSVATWQTTFRRKITPSSGFLDNVGYNNGPLEFRGNLGVTWNRGSLTAGITSYYFDSYKIYASNALASTVATSILNQGSDTVPSQIYHDCFVTYRSMGGSRGEQNRPWIEKLMAGTSITVGVRNLFNREPPILATAGTFGGGYSAYADPRLSSYYISLKRNF